MTHYRAIQKAALEYYYKERNKNIHTPEEIRGAFVTGAIWAEVNSGLDLNSMTFGEAIQLMKYGDRIRRSGWKDQGKYIWLKAAEIIPCDLCQDPRLKSIADENGGNIETLGTIYMKTEDNKILAGWTPSQADILSNDWTIVR